MAKILPFTGVDDGLPRIREEQEWAIQRMLLEGTRVGGTKSIINASNMDTGKTLQAAELVIRLGLQRVLYIGVKDTFDQWRDRLSDQSDGAIVLLRMDGTAPGKRNFEAFYAGAAGHYFTGSQYLTAQDWYSVELLSDVDGKPLTKVDATKTGRTGTAMFAVSSTAVTREGERTPGVATLTSKVTEQLQHRIFAKAKFRKHPLDMIVYDEIHVVANRKSIGRKTLMTIKSEWKLGMSGTWLGNKFENAWSLTSWAWPDKTETAFGRWKLEWCNSEEVYVKGGKTTTKLTGEKTPGKLVASLPCYIRIDGELEVPEPEIVRVHLTPQQRADYEDLERDLMVWLHTTKAGRKAVLVTDLPITLRSRLRTATLGVMSIDHETGELYFADDTVSSKLFALRGIVDRPHWQGEQVGIYTESKRFAKVIVKRMRAAGYNAVEWSGDIPSKQRTAIKKAFLAGEIQYLVSTIQSFSTGLDMFQTVCNKVVWVSESDNNMLNNQAIKRYFRFGRKAGFEHVKLVAIDTYDEGVLSANVRETLAMNASLNHEGIPLAA